jgi:hypothetical protein
MTDCNETTLDSDAQELLRHFELAKDQSHGLKSLLYALAGQLQPDWSADECQDHIRYMANELGEMCLDD